MPNDVGEIVTDCWIDMPRHFSTVMIDEFALLPDHFHGIVLIEQHTGTAFRFSPPAWTRVAATHTDSGRVQSDTSTSDQAVHDARSPSLSVITGSFKSAVSRISAPVRPPGKLWQRGFHDRIIRDQAELDACRKYIATNVQRHA